MRIVIPLAGSGKRFKDFYKEPKPLIPVNGKSMVQRVIENFGIDNEWIFVINKEMDDKYSINDFLKCIVPNCKVIPVNHTGGAACTALMASEYIDNTPLIIANCDQVVDMNPLIDYKGDGCILTFKSNHPKWSFARVYKNKVIEVAEKNPISEHATVGIYYFRNGLDFVTSAKKMIKKNITTKNGDFNEFYICPVYNEMILAGKDITIHEIPQEQMHGMGTPEDLKIYLEFLNR